MDHCGSPRKVAADRRRELETCERLAKAAEAAATGGPRAKKQRTDAEVARLAENQTDAEHLRRQIIVLKRECAIDDAALAALETRAAALLVEAVGALGDVVADGADASSDGLAKRAAATVVSLWLAHPDDAGATASVAACVARCAGSQILAFEPLLYQLSSRLAAHGASFQKVLADLLKKLAAAAPARTVLQIVALANGGQVDETDRGAAAFEANLEGPAAARVAAARKLQQALRKGASAKLVDGLASLADASARPRPGRNFSAEYPRRGAAAPPRPVPAEFFTPWPRGAAATRLHAEFSRRGRGAAATFIRGKTSAEERVAGTWTSRWRPRSPSACARAAATSARTPCRSRRLSSRGRASTRRRNSSRGRRSCRSSLV